MIKVKVEYGADAGQRGRRRPELLTVAYSFALRVSFPKALALVCPDCYVVPALPSLLQRASRLESLHWFRALPRRSNRRSAQQPLQRRRLPFLHRRAWSLPEG